MKGNFQARFWSSGGWGDSPTDCRKLSDPVLGAMELTAELGYTTLCGGVMTSTANVRLHTLPSAHGPFHMASLGLGSLSSDVCPCSLSLRGFPA